MASISIREARRDEWALVGELTYDAYEPLFDDLRWYGDELSDVAGRAEHGVILVALVEGSVVGAVCFLDDYTQDPSHAELAIAPVPGIRMLAVHPSSQRCGIGQALTETCIERARSLGATEIVLHTTDHLQAAQALYSRLNFVRHPQIDEHLDDEDPPVHIKGFVRSIG